MGDYAELGPADWGGPVVLPKPFPAEGEAEDGKGGAAGWGRGLGERRGPISLHCPEQNSKKPGNSKFQPGLPDL